ncbi:potassium channel subfamily k member 16 [Chrysochromulina tobinii]|uniref:Potassium channel subfamily k member 16 n=1 Tax=Chrysochromulina tobinii TaxID=1460289 RepID=A0A0M0JXX0_9EUKA|nr:potassium channel subfamily k member 16 [Chrysochromulina tobinii]|eukprot:KOO31486.1 potassium channel subfamily k member 16 [Chrysochromulina sp. CCMP291]
MSREDRAVVFAQRQAAVGTQARAALESALLADDTPIITTVVTTTTVYPIEASFPLAGATVESFGATEREAFRTGLATMLGVAASEVTITVSAGSVLVTAVVTASSVNMQRTHNTTLSSLDVSALYSALQVNTSVPQVAVQPPIVINVTTNVTTIPVNPAREEFLTGMVRTYQTLDEDATTSTLLDQFFSYLMDSCIGGAPGPEDLNWTFNGATFFMMTIVTTIGYGTFAPSLPIGRSMVILFGSVTIVLFGLVSRPAVDVVEAIEARTERLLLRARRSEQPLSEQGQQILKGASAMLLCHAVLMAAAVIVYLDRDEEDPLHEEWDFGTCYYFCFVTFSSIGLGDFSLGPADNSNYELGRLLVQALIIMFGMAAFNLATGACSGLVLPHGAALRAVGISAPAAFPLSLRLGVRRIEISYISL